MQPTDCQNKKKRNRKKKSAAESLTTDFHYITAEKLKSGSNQKIKSVEKIYSCYYCNRNQPISVRFFGCEFYQFYNRIGFFEKCF